MKSSAVFSGVLGVPEHPRNFAKTQVEISDLKFKADVVPDEKILKI